MPPVPESDSSAAPENSVIRIFGVEDPADGRAERSLFRRADEMRYGRTDVPVHVLRGRLAEFLDSMQEVLEGLPPDVSTFHLETVTLTVEISAKGTVSLLGSGGEIGGSAGLTFELTRR